VPAEEVVPAAGEEAITGTDETEVPAELDKTGITTWVEELGGVYIGDSEDSGATDTEELEVVEDPESEDSGTAGKEELEVARGTESDGVAET